MGKADRLDDLIRLLGHGPDQQLDFEVNFGDDVADVGEVKGGGPDRLLVGWIGDGGGGWGGFGDGGSWASWEIDRHLQVFLCPAGDVGVADQRVLPHGCPCLKFPDWNERGLRGRSGCQHHFLDWLDGAER